MATRGMALMQQAVTSGGGALGSSGSTRRPALLSARGNVALVSEPKLVRDARGAPVRSGAFPRGVHLISARPRCLRRGFAPMRAAVAANTI